MTKSAEDEEKIDDQVRTRGAGIIALLAQMKHQHHERSYAAQAVQDRKMMVFS